MKNTATIKVLKTIAEMRRFSAEARRRGRKIGLVPTMGSLHEGHLSLVRAARRRADDVVVSIFVNPAQFGPREDLSGYPRDLAGDVAKLAELGVAAVFTPVAEEMYAPGPRAWVEVEDLAQRLCGRARPTHFRGVATVVMKLFQIVAPHHAWFGQKDYQQLLVVRRMVRDLNLEVEVHDVPTVRDGDGLALSSRNSYLLPEQRPAALTLQQALQVAERLAAKGERSAAKIISNMREVIRSQPGTEIEYLAICNAETLHEIESVEARTLVALAVRVGRARLIDNVLLDLRLLQERRLEAAKNNARPAPPPARAPAPPPAKPAPAPAPKAPAKPVAKPAAKPPVKSAAKPQPKPVAKAPAKPAAKPVAKPVAKVVPPPRKATRR